jgi:DNA-binding PucR family transcriptional regulator
MLSRGRSTDVPLAFGEPGVGVQGWRLTHHQARDAWGVAIHLPQRLTWYADVMLLAAALRNDTLASSLKQKYLAPLRSEKDGGMALRKTLRAYIDAGCSATSAESDAGVGRHTVADRARKAEQLIGQSVRACLPELDMALRLEELGEQRPR